METALLASEPRAPTSLKAKIAYGALAAVGCVGAVAGIVSMTSSSSSSAAVNLRVQSTDEYEVAFKRFTAEHHKEYATIDEYATRFAIFKSNMDYIRTHNQNDYPYQMGINQFADLSREEFAALYLGANVPKRSSTKHVKTLDTTDLPASVDWRTKNAVNAIKDQGQCGSCWAFSTIGAVEGRVAIASGTLNSLSEQQLVDCSSAQGNMGCSGGWMDQGFQYIISNKGIDGETAYPYTAQNGVCKATASPIVATITSFADVAANDEAQLQAAVAAGPVAVAIEADQMSFQFYTSGVFTGPCGTQLDHGVVVVGYGTDAGKDYWIVRNSWGASWGDEGYIRIQRNTGGEGLCGIAMKASYPVV